MFLVPLLFIIFIVWILVSVSRSINSNSPDNNTINNTIAVNKPLEILKERYAKGEITDEEYLKIKRNLV